MTAEDIVAIRQISATGVLTQISRDDYAMAVTTNVITVTGVTFINSDTFVIYTNITRDSAIQTANEAIETLLAF